MKISKCLECREYIVWDKKDLSADFFIKHYGHTVTTRRHKLCKRIVF